MSKKAASVASKRAGRSLHIGLNAVAPAHYGGWSGPLAACEFDANDMADIARSRGISREGAVDQGGHAREGARGHPRGSKAVEEGRPLPPDLLGTRRPDARRDGRRGRQPRRDVVPVRRRADRRRAVLRAEPVRPGVRILVLSDSCHSGTVTRAPVSAGADAHAALPDDASREWLTPRIGSISASMTGCSARSPRRRVGRSSVDPDSALSQLVVKPRLERIAGKFRATSILISGCQDNQTSMDGDRNGAFTEALLRVWADGAFTGDYRRFHAAIRGRLPASQSPNLFTLGRTGTFAKQRPFTV